MRHGFLKSLATVKVDPQAIWLLFGLSAVVGLGYGLFAWLAPSVVIEWSTGSELDTVGYNLYRSDDPSGDYVRVNPQLIPAGEDAMGGGQYAFTDTEVRAGRRYYYMLEEINTEGNGTRYGPRVVEPVGRIELSLAGALFAGGLLGLGALALRRRREAASAAQVGG